MQDLLNEDEFLEKSYNPWKVFRWYYLAAAISVGVLYTIGVSIEDRVTNPNLVLVLLLIMMVGPLYIGPLMIWANKKNFLLPRSTLLMAMLLLNGLYVAFLSTIALISELKNGLETFPSEGFVWGLLAVIIIYAIVFGILSAIILTVAARKKRWAGII